MTDKEVSELWQSLHAKDWHLAWISEDIRDCAISLIRKLVKERAERYADPSVGEPGIIYALHDFNIDLAAWPKK